MSTSLAFRRACRSDSPTLATIRRDAILLLATPVMGGTQAREWAESSAEERVHRAIEQNEVWVADQGDAAAGWVEIAANRVEGLYVRPDVSGGGIGSALLLHAESLIQSAGHATAALDASWNADAFYLRRGYEAQADRVANEGRPMLKPLTDTCDRHEDEADAG